MNYCEYAKVLIKKNTTCDKCPILETCPILKIEDDADADAEEKKNAYMVAFLEIKNDKT